PRAVRLLMRGNEIGQLLRKRRLLVGIEHADQARGVIVIEVVIIAGGLIPRLVRIWPLATHLQIEVIFAKGVEPRQRLSLADAIGFPKPQRVIGWLSTADRAARTVRGQSR